MTDRYAGRLTILEDQEIDELYGLPRFTPDERVHFFAPSLDERDAADRHHTLANRVLFILQAGVVSPNRRNLSSSPNRQLQGL